jgi:kynurenine formamidase
MERGDNSDTTAITVSSHSGSHLDVPRHFCPDGKTVKEIIPSNIRIAPVYCITINKTSGTPLQGSDIEPFITPCKDAAGIFIRTGMYSVRDIDSDRYCSRHPWVHPEVPSFLREHCPEIQIFGTDTISISSPAHREEGRECHRRFLCGRKPILLVEDMDLSNPNLSTEPLAITIYPWIVDELDGVPVLAFAESFHRHYNNASAGERKS